MFIIIMFILYFQLLFVCFCYYYPLLLVLSLILCWGEATGTWLRLGGRSHGDVISASKQRLLLVPPMSVLF